MTDPRGPWFELRNAHDLFAKLERDLKRVEAGPRDSYAAFDFFVTANHLLDWWLPPGSRKQRDKSRKADLNRPEQDLARLCRDLANGLKHFSVPGDTATSRHRGGFDAGFDRGFDIDRLVVTQPPRPSVSTGVHEGDFSDEFDRDHDISRLVVRSSVAGTEGPGEELDVYELAQRVVEEWRARLREEPPPHAA
jgi:hypothetical protein